MKKKYLSKIAIVFFTVLFIPSVCAVEIAKSNISHNAYVILLGTFVKVNDARAFANQFEKEQIYILKDEEVFTVRIVNIDTRLQALEKLEIIRKTVPDAILWKKMKFLEEKGFNKFHSQIYTIDQTEEDSTNAEG